MSLDPSNTTKKLGFASRLWRRIVGFFAKTKTNTETKLDKELVLKIKSPKKIPSLGQFLYLSRLTKKWEKISLTAAFILLLGSLGYLVVNFYLSHRTFLPKQGGEYVEAIVGAPKFINPIWANANAADRDISYLVYAGLFRYNNNLEITPDLASDYQISEDGKVYTIHLKQNLKWQDGEPLTSSDVIFTTTIIQDPSFKSVISSGFRDVAVSAPDETTIQFTLPNPSGTFIHQLTVGILPEHLWSDVSAEHAPLAELNLKPIGSGPFRFKTLKKTKQGTIVSYTLESNPFYHLEKSYLHTITFKFFQNYESAVDAVSRGNADGVSFVPFNLQEKLFKKDIKSYDLLMPQITALFFNTRHNSMLGEKPIREALTRSINKEAILSTAFHNGGTIINGPMLNGEVGFTDDVTKYDFNIEEAKTILENDGWKIGEGETVRVFKGKTSRDKRFTANTKLHVSIAAVNIPEYVKAAEIIRDQWSSIGVEVELVISDPSKIERDIINPRAYDTLIYGEILGSYSDLFPFWHSSQITSPGVNLAGYTNRRVDALIEETRTLSNQDEVAKRFVEIQKTITSELPAVFLLTPTYSYAVGKRVRGIEIGRLGNPADRFSNINKWFVRTHSKFEWNKQ